jgi:succinate dehydrogenase/fumarate reductase cytochrome b subunit
MRSLKIARLASVMMRDSGFAATFFILEHVLFDVESGSSFMVVDVAK